MNKGVWALWSRGSGRSAAFPLTGWKEVSDHYGPSPRFEELLAAFLVMKSQGQHVRLEWMPEEAYGNVPKVNPDHDFSEEMERERTAWYGASNKIEATGLGYV